MWSLWLIAAGIFFIVEIVTTGFLVFWLAIGALLSMITSFITDSIVIQTLVFVVSSCILIPLTKPLADKFTEKTPIDGLQGKTDEDNLGFTYAVLDKYIRTGICEDEKTKERIDYLHRINQFKLELMPVFQYEPERN